MRQQVVRQAGNQAAGSQASRQVQDRLGTDREAGWQTGKTGKEDSREKEGRQNGS